MHMSFVRRDALRRRHQGYSGARPDVVRLVPMDCVRILDVGCGAGMTADLLRQRNAEVIVIGVEPDSSLAAHANAHVQRVIAGRIDDPQTMTEVRKLAPFDAIILADVLEHMLDPWNVLEEMRGLLGPGGVILTSIPNVRHISTFIALGVLGEWPMRSRGIHDRTHLRWFTRRNIMAMAEQAGLQQLREARNLRLVESAVWTSLPARLVDFWPLRGFFTFQYLHLWKVRGDVRCA